MSTFDETLANTYLKQFSAMSADLSKMTKGLTQFSEGLRVATTMNALLSQKVRDAALQMANSPALKAQTQEAAHQFASQIAGNAAVRAAALEAINFPKISTAALSPALTNFAQTLRLAQSIQLEGMQASLRKIADQAVLINFQPKMLAIAAGALKSVDVGIGARMMEQSLLDPQVEALTEALVATARDQGLTGAALDETDDAFTSVDKIAVILFVFLVGAALYRVTRNDPETRDQVAFILTLLAACGEASRRINGDR